MHYYVQVQIMDCPVTEFIHTFVLSVASDGEVEAKVSNGKSIFQEILVLYVVMVEAAWSCWYQSTSTTMPS